MEIKAEVSEERIEKLIRSVMENMPEGTLCLRCTGWDYEKCEYQFCDDDEEEMHEVDYPKLRKGFELLINTALRPKDGHGFYASGWDPNDFFKDDWEDWEGDWDACVIDGMVQCAIFGDVIYG